MTAGGTAIPEVQRLLCALAAGKRVAEAGAAFGETAALMAQTAASAHSRRCTSGMAVPPAVIG